MRKKSTLFLSILVISLLPWSTSLAITEHETSSDFSVNYDGYIDITIEEAWVLLNDTSNGIQIPIDVRTDSEWANEHINTPAPENPRHHCVCEWDNETILQEFMSFYEGKEIIIYCRSGVRSVTASNMLVDNGFVGTVYNMLGGINAWKAAGFPTIANLPPEIPTITGTTSGKAGNEYEYTIVTNDPESDDVSYYIDWGDNNTVYVGPYGSGEEITVKHIWEEKETYIISIKSIDYYLDESDWATLEVTMPKSNGLSIGVVSTSLSDTELEISDVRGGFGSVIIEIKNVGDATAEGIASTVSVVGGLMGGIDIVHICSGCSSCGTSLEPGSIKTENTRKSGFIFGVGSIGITASAWADNADEVSVTTSGYAIGPFVIIR